MLLIRPLWWSPSRHKINVIDLLIVVEPIEAQNVTDAPILVEPIEAQN
jgi:hypothetical protein